MTLAPASQGLLFDLEPVEPPPPNIVPDELIGVHLPADVVGSMTRDQKCAFILEHWPAARKEDRLTMLGYWAVFDNLDDLLGVEAFQAFAAAFVRITTPETVRRGRQSLQQLRSGTGHLLPDEQTIAYRRSRDGAGPPGRMRNG